MKIIKQLFLAGSLTGLCLLLSGCDDQAAMQTRKISPQTWQLPISEVAVVALPRNYVTTGSVISDQRIEVTSRATGFIQEILVREGERIVKGQPLIMLDDADIKGAIEQAQSVVNKSLSALKDAQTDLDRFETLFKHGSISGEKLRKTKLVWDVAEDTLQEAEAALHTAQAQRQYVRITSPITGVVVARHKRQGDLTVPGAPILTVESDSGLLFETYVAESRLGKLRQDDVVQVDIDALDKPLAGIITRIVPSADPLTRKFLVKIALPEQEGLMPGMFGRSYFQLGTEQATVISPNALTQRGGLQGVFVVDKQNNAHFRWLRTGKVNDNYIEILAGLQAGELVVITPNARLHEGDFITREETARE